MEDKLNWGKEEKQAWNMKKVILSKQALKGETSPGDHNPNARESVADGDKQEERTVKKNITVSFWVELSYMCEALSL